MKRLFVATAALTGCLAASCTLLVDTDGLAGDPLSPDAEDGRASPLDPAADAAEASKGAPMDASTRFCPVTGALLCDDFDDDDASLPGPFDNVSVDDGASLLAVSTRSLSAPRSLQMQTSAGSHHALLGQDLSVGGGATIAFDLYIDARGGNLTAASFIIDGNAGQLYLQPQDDNQTMLSEQFPVSGNTMFESTAAPPIPLGAWAHVSLDVDFGTRVATLTSGGATTTRTLRSSWAAAKTVTAGIGTFSTGNANVYYDNVVITQR